MSRIFEIIASGDVAALQAGLGDGETKNLNVSNASGEYPIHAAVKAKGVKLVEVLCKAGANVNQPSEESGSMKGYTPAHYAARSGDIDMILLLAKFKADFNREADDHWKPVHCAAFAGKRLALLALLDNGAEVDARNQHGHTPLIYAANHGRIDDVRQLLSRGASVITQDPNGDSLMHHVFHYQMSKLFEGGYDIPDVQLDVAVVLAINNVPIDVKNNDGNTYDFFLKDDIPSASSLVRVLAHNGEKFRASKTEWNYNTLLSARVEHFLGMGMEMKHAMDIYELVRKVDQERIDAKKRRDEERPAGGCPVMRGKKKPAAPAGEAPASGHPPIGDKLPDPNGPDPSGGQCPFFKKKEAPLPAVAAPAPPAAAAAAPAKVSQAIAHAFDETSGKVFAQGAPPTPSVAPSLSLAFLFENRTQLMMMAICFFCGIWFEQMMARLFRRV
jgi:hypothetical protein